MTNTLDMSSESTRHRNRKLGLLLSTLAVTLAVGCYIYLDVTQYNPFTKPSMMERSDRGNGH
ncbi:MAG: hypothetical protein OEM52_03025 [bacterium]|nr:hypothetical protein [bacterium]